MTAKERKAKQVVSFQTTDSTLLERYDAINEKKKTSHEAIYKRGLETIEKERT